MPGFQTGERRAWPSLFAVRTRIRVPATFSKRAPRSTAIRRASAPKESSLLPTYTKVRVEPEAQARPVPLRLPGNRATRCTGRGSCPSSSTSDPTGQALSHRKRVCSREGRTLPGQGTCRPPSRQTYHWGRPLPLIQSIVGCARGRVRSSPSPTATWAGRCLRLGHVR